jgi:predicted O-linked N-acetylglucosamine transferase (SPINDLY family)
MATIPEALQTALQHHQAGHLPEAETLYRQILQAHPDHSDVLHLLGVIAHQAGKHEIAVEHIARAIALNPTAAEYHSNIGEAYRALARLNEAEASCQQALALKPDYAEAHNNLGNALKAQGKVKEAAARYRQAIAHKPDYAEAMNNLGVVLHVQGKLEEALTYYRQALAIKPGYAEVYNNLGNVFREQDKLPEAADSYRQALAIKPGYAEACNNLGNVFRKQDKLPEAVNSYRQALALLPDFAEAYNNLGAVLQEQGSTEESEGSYRKAIKIKPGLAEAYNNLGSLLREQGKLEEAIACFRQAIACKPELAEAYICLGNALWYQSKPEEAAACYQQAYALQPNDGIKIKLATMLPTIVGTRQDVTAVRKKYEEQVNGLLDEGVTLKDPLKEVGQTNFYLAYHGQNDRELQVKIARLYEQACPSLLYSAPHCSISALSKKKGKIKVGFISKFLFSHSVALTVRGLLANLSREKFRVYALCVPPDKKDNMSTLVEQAVDEKVLLPGNLPEARKRIAEMQLDILFYLDIGMEPFTYFLAFSRLAPVQCVFPGHPVTTGIRAMDYFVSSKFLEPDNAQTHYSERLVRLKSLPTYYYKPEIPSETKSKKHFGLEENKTIYLCPQTLFKFPPEFDDVMAKILRADPKGEVVLVEGVEPHWTRLLKDRFERSIPDVVARVRFLPRMNGEDFLRLLTIADVVLDTIHFGGGTTSLMSLGLGAPVVTLPGQFMRGRATYGCYKQMGVMDCVAKSPAQYVKIAVRLGTDRAFREATKQKILARNHVLYENHAVVREYEQFFIHAVEEARKGGRKSFRRGARTKTG